MERCSDSTIKELLQDDSAECFKDLSFDIYFKTVRIEISIGDSHLDLSNQPSNDDFFPISTSTRSFSSGEITFSEP